jgi:hypothetical protein
MTAALRLVEPIVSADDARFAAFSRRDGRADGSFWVCVRTTQIYCRPSCPARPLPKNVEFADSRAEAALRGYRPCKRCAPDRFVPNDLAQRLDEIDWDGAQRALRTEGFAGLGALLSFAECDDLIASYTDDGAFRSTVCMARHGFGRGEYRYFADPLPKLVADLRARLYARLAPLASQWSEALGRRPYPATHDAYRRLCAQEGQTRPTPLILKYGPGDHNCLHQDLYGGEVFPIQVAILLSEPGKDFDGGEFVLTEQRPRRQSRASVVPLRKGEAVAFAVNDRPVEGARGVYRASMRHGVSALRSGARYALGVICHDAP